MDRTASAGAGLVPAADARPGFVAAADAGAGPVRHAAAVIEVAVLDASRAYAEALGVAIGAEPDLSVRCAVTSTAELRRCEALSPSDVVVCDVGLFEPAARPPGGRVGGWPRLGADRADRVVVLVADRTQSGLLAPALRAGVRGWVPREGSTPELLGAVREAYAGGTCVPSRLLTAALAELTRGHPDRLDAARNRLDRLTPREREVLACLVEGLGRAETAARLHVSANTVRTHVQSILTKLEVSSSVAAASLATGADG
jgi:DNA-binding NarL/FixJ family response regulator